ncbi:hypothetical protein V6N13_021591 [Hibiscus sabdariffa]
MKGVHARLRWFGLILNEGETELAFKDIETWVTCGHHKALWLKAYRRECRNRSLNQSTMAGEGFENHGYRFYFYKTLK